MIGNFNTGLHRIDETGKTFHCADAFARMTEQGWQDAWRLRNGDTREFSWFSNAGNGFRIDHAFVTKDVAKRVEVPTYDHTTRESLTQFVTFSIR